MDIVILIVRLFLAGIFGLAGLTKLLDQPGTQRSLGDFGVPTRWTSFFAYLLPLGELACAASLLLARSLARWGALVCLSLLLVFIAAIVYNLSTGRRPACHCFGQLHSTPIGPGILVRNGLLAGLAGLVVIGWNVPESGITRMLTGLSAGQAAASVGGLMILILMGGEAWFLLQLFHQHGRLLLRLDELEKKLSSNTPLDLPPSHAALAAMKGLPVGNLAPGFELANLSGEITSLADLRAGERPVMLVFTDPECGPCELLLPEIRNWQHALADQLTLTVMSRGSKDAIGARAIQHGLVNVLQQVDFEAGRAYQVNGTPSAVLISANGTIAAPLAEGVEAIRNLVSWSMPLALGALQSAISGRGNGNGHHPGGNGYHGRERSNLEAPQMEAQSAPFALGQPAPAVHLPDLSGKILDLADWRGRSTLVLFWNPDCGFCARMLPDLKAWEANSPPEAPQLLVVSTGSREANQAMGLRSAILLDESFSVGRAFGASGTPSAVLLDDQGRIASEVGVGAQAVLALAGALNPQEGAWMNPNLFDELTRQAAAGFSRRDFLKSIALAAGSGLLALLGFDRSAGAGSTTSSSIYLPMVFNQVGNSRPLSCTAASACNDRKYCNLNQTCICIKSAEGDIKCGAAPTSCYSPLCQTSADCAFLGEGYFCDTPNSGCCTDPSAERTRCIAPCNAPCAPERTCGSRCCHIDEICLNGDCMDCPVNRDCITQCCPPGQVCSGTSCVPDTSSCPDCGTCTTCTIDGDCQAWCEDPCATGSMCRKASLRADFKKLSDYLTVQGFAVSGEMTTLALTNDLLIRMVLNSPYSNAVTGDTANLFYSMEVTGVSQAFAVVTTSLKTAIGLWVDNKGAVQQVAPSAGWIPFNPQPDQPTAPQGVTSPNADMSLSCTICNGLCRAGVSVLCNHFGAGLCVPAGFAGPGGIASCASTLALKCMDVVAKTATECRAICDDILAVELKSDRYNCGSCKNVCNSGASTCCNGTCTDLNTDPLNCGTCHDACLEGSGAHLCCNGTCQLDCCPPLVSCGGVCCDGTICAPEGGCCPNVRICNGICCPANQVAIFPNGGTTCGFCCSTVQACPVGFGTVMNTCCAAGQICSCGVSGCSCK